MGVRKIGEEVGLLLGLLFSDRCRFLGVTLLGGRFDNLHDAVKVG